MFPNQFILEKFSAVGSPTLNRETTSCHVGRNDKRSGTEFPRGCARGRAVLSTGLVQAWPHWWAAGTCGLVTHKLLVITRRFCTTLRGNGGTFHWAPRDLVELGRWQATLLWRDLLRYYWSTRWRFWRTDCLLS